MPDARVVVLMGVAGAGKTTIATLLAQRLGWDEVDGDELHPPRNIAKMAAGEPLDDADRGPWLARVAAWIDAHLSSGRPGIVTCSALRRAYRAQLAREGVDFVLLTADAPTLAARLASRPGHFMGAQLLPSQLATLEAPGADEAVLTVETAGSPDDTADRIVAALGLAPARAAATVRVRFWAGARRAAGHAEETVTAATLADLRTQLAARAELARVVAAASFLVDEAHVSDAAPLREGAVVDVLPPFAGGASPQSSRRRGSTSSR